MKLLAGSSHPVLAAGISKELSISLCDCKLGRFSNGEIQIEINENIRNEDVFLIQTGAGTDELTVNDIIMETVIMIDACKRSMAKSITLVMPLFPYSRQDKKNDSRSPISAKVIATMFEQAGMTRMVTMDLHAPQIQGFFNVPVDNIYSLPLVVDLFSTFPQNKYVIISPDAGGMKRAVKFGNALNLPVYGMYKERNYSALGKINQMQLMGDSDNVKGRVALILDDMTDTCGTLVRCADTLKAMGALECKAIVTHGVLSPLGLERLSNNTSLDTLYSSNTLPKPSNDKLLYFSIDVLMSKVIKCLLTGGSISSLFQSCHPKISDH